MKRVLCKLPESDVPLRTLIDLDAPQAILYTSGTTGQPKGAIITYGMQWWNAVGSALNLGHNLDDRWLACLPLYLHRGSHHPDAQRHLWYQRDGSRKI